MPAAIRFVLVLHDHQPVGNFDGVIEQAYQDSYLPMLDVLESYPQLRIGLHTSGSLMEWLDEHHSEYVDRLAGCVATGRIEIIGGAFYEPILTMIPPRDRVGQIRRYTRWLEDRLGAKVRGMWMPERVWEQSLTSDLAEAGIEYTMLDDSHFKNAGLREDQLYGHYVTEDNGRLLTLFPGSEALRYLIPFADPQQTIDTLRHIAEVQPGAVVMFADDGEKFGTWPETKKHVYENGWLRQFFDLLIENQDWLKVTTPSEAMDHVPPLGKIYVPEGSYREMTEWVLPIGRQSELQQLRHDFEQEGYWKQISQFIRGGYWRNFKVKYPESNEMYCRMLQISSRLEAIVKQAGSTAIGNELLDFARQELYRGQCNCPYWHGAFGGIYLPHLRNAIYQHLIAADNLLDQAIGRESAWIEANSGDFNFDARQEVSLANDKLSMLLAPAAGGILYELDVRSIGLNLLATLARRPEAYHQQVLAGPQVDEGEAASIHDRVVFKQAGLDQRLQYDAQPRKSLLDHFYPLDAQLDAVTRSEVAELGDFLGMPYEAKLRRNRDQIQVQLTRQGIVEGIPLLITKGVTLQAGSSQLEIAWLIEGLPEGRTLHFAPELNFAGLPSGADDRYFYDDEQHRLGQLGKQLDLPEARSLGLVDQWLGIDVNLSFNRPTNLWTYPVETVSQSEGGFELVHQSVVVQPHWHIQGDAQGAWTVTLRLAIDTQAAETRRPQIDALATS